MTKWKAFLCSALVTLFCLVPLYLLVIGSSLFGAAAADTPAEGVPILTPAPEDSLTLLAAVDGPAPCAALLRLDAWHRRAECLVLPENTLLPDGDALCPLEELFRREGPLAVRGALARLTGQDCQRYLCLAPDELAGLFGEYAPVLHWDVLGPIRDLVLLRRFAFNGGQGAISSATAQALLRSCDGGPEACARLRCALYGKFLEAGLQTPGTLSGAVTGLLRGEQPPLTDISAVDLYGVERLLDLLAADPPPVQCQIPEGYEAARGWQLTDAGLLQLRQLLAGEPEPPRP